MLTIDELRSYARRFSCAEFGHQIGPFALVQRPPDAVVAHRAAQLGAQRTVFVKRSAKAEQVSLLFQLAELSVATLPPMEGDAILTVGRMPDCELVVDDPSVSKRHAQIGWDALSQIASVTDLGSSNGTRLNGVQVNRQVELKDIDALSFGDASYLFLRTETLWAYLVAPPGGPEARRADIDDNS